MTRCGSLAPSQRQVILGAATFAAASLAAPAWLDKLVNWEFATQNLAA